MIRRLILVFLLFIFFQSCYVGRFFLYNMADVRDYKKFPKTELHKSSEPFYFADGTQTRKVKLPKTMKVRRKSLSFEQALKKTGTIAFLVIRNDSILYQWYRPHKDKSSITSTFSMSKSFISA